MKNALKQLTKKFLNDESAQGAAEYVLLLVVIVALVVVFKGKIKDAFTSKVGGLADDITNFNGNN